MAPRLSITTQPPTGPDYSQDFDDKRYFHLDPVQFSSMLACEGFTETVVVDREADGFLDVHTHPFEARALILKGEIRIVCGPTEQVYRAGDVFHLAAHQPHAEHYGPEGVSYLVGRK